MLGSESMKLYSKDLRVRVLAAVDGGVAGEEVAKIFSVSGPTINRWLKRRHESGDVESEPIPARPSVKGAADQQLRRLRRNVSSCRY